MRSDGKHDMAAIVPVPIARDKPLGHAAIHQFDSAVVPQAKPLGQMCNRRCGLCGCAGELQEQLMLLRLKPGLMRRRLAGLQEPSNLVPKRCQRPHQRRIANFGLHGRRHDVSYHDVLRGVRRVRSAEGRRAPCVIG